MINKITQEKAKIISEMEQQLKNELLKDEPEKLWEESFIKRQIDKRNRGELFSVTDHIRAMVYSMLSSGISWNRVAKDIQPDTKCVTSVDEIFYDYDAEQLLNCTPEQLRDAAKSINCGTQSTLKQMEALLSVNIPKLLKLEKEYGTVDSYYDNFIQKDKTLKALVKTLSDVESKDKMAQMGIALVCEYLRNVGYDIPKPDRHIRRILGSNTLAFSSNTTASPFDVFDIISEVAVWLNKSLAEVDYILWSYCANGYGGVCTVAKPKCDICVAKKYCEKKGNQKNGRFI